MIERYLSLVKFSHTIFALPFALIGYSLAISEPFYSFNWQKLLYIILCMIFARNSAMAFNRLIDKDIDSINPRTAQIREIPNGSISPNYALLFIIINCILFIFSTYLINKICFLLSPVTLIIILGYSFTKRFTSLCHFILGLGLSLSPIGAYLAITGKFNILPLLFSLIVLLWVSGFDIIYSLQDENFDKKYNLHSIPSLLGKKKSLNISRILHLGCSIIIILIGIQYYFFSLFYFMGSILFISLLINQHRKINLYDLSKIDKIFFTNNGLASISFGLLVMIDLFI